MNDAIRLYALCSAGWVIEDLRSVLSMDYGSINNEDGTLFVSTVDGCVRLSECSVYGQAEPIVVISVESMEPPIVAQAWELLIYLFIQRPSSVWLSTYQRPYLEAFGVVEDLIVDGVCGFVIGRDSFDKMIS